MNYFAHGWMHVEDCYFMAGTAVPDWLCVLDRRMRARSKLATQWIDCDDPQVAAIARGIVLHHQDDDAFHRTRAFAELSLNFVVTIRDLLPRDDGFRPSFLGHILVEILLDAALIEEAPQKLEQYYDALLQLDPLAVQQAVNRMATRQSDGIVLLIPKFCEHRFLYDYADDAKLLGRLNTVMKRVKLPMLPDELCEMLPDARQLVRQRKRELLDNTSVSEISP